MKKRYPESQAAAERRRVYGRSKTRLAGIRAWGATVQGCVSLALSKARHRAKERGLDYSLDSHASEITRVVQEGRCQLTGLRFDLEGKDKRFRPSLDRIDSSKGYTPDNVRVVLTCVNKMLQDYGEDFLLVMADAIRTNRVLS